MTALKDKYINPLTDFGFKKLFGTEPRFFEAAEIAKFSPEERHAYEDSLKYYRDMKNVVDTSRDEGIVEGIEKGVQKRNLEIAKKMKEKGMPNSEISELTGLSEEEINSL